MAAAHKGRSARAAQFVRVEEDVATPVVCDRCLGPSELLRMTKEVAGKRCGVCARPFTLFSWRIAADARVKATVICRACAEARGKCQSCLCAMPVPGAGGGGAGGAGGGAGTRRERDGDGDGDGDEADLSGTGSRRIDLNMHRAKICSFFAKGQCTRGAACPFRHEQASPPASGAIGGGGGGGGADASSIRRRFAMQPAAPAAAAPPSAAASHAGARAPANSAASGSAAQRPAAKGAGGDAPKKPSGLSFDWMNAPTD